jgi:CDP-paratose 2-epimerase
VQWELADTNRIGDHKWWISDLADFGDDYPDWKLRYDVDAILREIHDANVEQWSTTA